MPLPENLIFNLHELVCDWGKKFNKPDLRVENILNYGIDGVLIINANLHGDDISGIEHYVGKELFSERSPELFDELSADEKNQESFLVGEIKYPESNYLKPLGKGYLKDMLLSSNVYHVGRRGIMFGAFPNYEVIYFKINDEGYYPRITMKDLYILREDKLAFEKEHQLAQNIDPQEDAKANQKQASYEENTLLPYLNQEHKHFAPDLFLAIKMWNHFYKDKKIQSKNILEQVEKWLKENKKGLGEYYSSKKEFPSEALCKRLAQIITPKHRKGGGAVLTEQKNSEK